MNKIYIFLFFFIFPFSAIADMRVATRLSTGEFLQAQSAAPPGHLIEDAVKNGIPANDVIERMMTDNQYASFMDGLYAPDIVTARTQKIAEIKNTAQNLYNSISLQWGTGAGDNYKTALLAAQTQAETDLAALSDIANAKNYQPIWPATP